VLFKIASSAATCSSNTLRPASLAVFLLTLDHFWSSWQLITHFLAVRRWFPL